MSAAELVMKVLFVCCASIGPVMAQIPLTPAAEKFANEILDGAVTGDKLNCDATPWRPFFDFSFRFEVGYVIQCPYRQFAGEASHLITVARVRPIGGKPVLLGEIYNVPALPEKLRSQMDISKFKGELELSGAVGVGEGDYEVEFLVADNLRRYYRKKWKVHAHAHGAEKRAETSLKPNEVAPLALLTTGNREPVTRGQANDKPLRITVLLDATPINPVSRKLRAWDRAFLLGSVASLMRQLPSATVRLVAFNIDQQKELFRAEKVDGKTFPQLGEALRELELGTVSYRTLQRRGGWEQLVNEMLVSESGSADALVLLGPQIRQDAKIPREVLSCSPDSGPRLFYLKYLAFAGHEFADSLDHITKDCKGRVLGFHSPGELGAAIEKMREDLPDAK